MKIGIIGKGDVSQAPATVLGVRAPSDLDQGRLADVAEWADLVILTTPWQTEAAGAADIGGPARGRPVLDATNPATMTKHGPDLATGDVMAPAAERLRSRLPGTFVVKTFNQVGGEIMADPSASSERPVMFAAGDDEAARNAALTLVANAGFRAMDAGPLANARHLESLTMIWIRQAINAPLGRGSPFALSRHAAEDGR